MPQIFVLSGPDVGLQRDVAAGAVIGRGDDCAVHLRDPSVSRQHARIEKNGDAFEVVDLGSRNGIGQGDQRATRIPLTSGTEFVVGTVRMRFVDMAPGAVEEIELTDAPVLTTGTAPKDVPLTTAAAPKGVRPTPEVGSARRRALANKEGILQFTKIEGAPESILRDDMAQQGPLVKIILTLGALTLAGVLAYGAFRLAAFLTPEGGSSTEEPAEPERPR